MTLDELEEEIRTERREREVHIQAIFDAIDTMRKEYEEVARCDLAIDGMRNREIKELRHKLYVYERDPKI